MASPPKSRLPSKNSRFLKTNVHFEQVKKDVLRSENLLPHHYQSLEKIKECIEDQNNDSIKPKSECWALRHLLPVAPDITCIKYMELPAISYNQNNVHPYVEGQHKFVGCRGLWLGHRDGTISIYSPVAKKIKESVFDFENKLKDVIHINYFYTKTEFDFCFVTAGCKNGDIGIMCFYENRSGTHIFSHKITSPIKQIISSDCVIFILTEDKRLNAYQLSFNIDKSLKNIECHPKRIEGFDTLHTQGSIDEIFLEGWELFTVTFDPKNNTEQVYCQPFELDYLSYYKGNYGIKSFYFKFEKILSLPTGGSLCPDHPNDYYFQQNSDKLHCYDKDKKEISLPFTIETSFGIEKPKIEIKDINSAFDSSITYLNQSTFDVYTSSNIQEGKYEKHKRLKNVKFGIYKEELIMVITQNNELEVYDYRGDSQIIHALDSQISCLNISVDSRYCAYAGQDGLLGIINLNNNPTNNSFNLRECKKILSKNQKKVEQSDCENEEKIKELQEQPEYKDITSSSVLFLDHINLDLLVVGFIGHHDTLRRVSAKDKTILWEKYIRKEIASVIVSKNEIIAGFTNGSICIYDFSGNKTFSYKFQNKKVSPGGKLACTSDNNLIIFAMSDEIRIYDRKSKLESVLMKYSGNVVCFGGDVSQIKISEDDKILYVLVHQTKNITAYSLQAKQKVLEAPPIENQFQPDKAIFLQNKKYISYWQYNHIEISDINSGKAIFKRAKEESKAVAASLDGRLILTGGSCGLIKIFNVAPLFEGPKDNIPPNPTNTYKVGEKNFEGKDEHEIFGVASSENNEYLAVEYGSTFRNMVVYHKMEFFSRIKLSKADSKAQLFLTRDNNYIIRIIGTQLYKIDIQKQLIVQINAQTFKSSSCDFDPRSLCLYSQYLSESVIRIFSLEEALAPEKFSEFDTIQETRTIPREGKSFPMLLKLSPDGNLLVVLTHYKDIEVYDARTGNIMNFIHKEGALSHLYLIHSHDLVISHNNKYIATFYEKKVQVYHLDSQQQVQCCLDFSGGKKVEADTMDMFFPKKKSGLEISKNGKYVISFFESEIKVLDIEANKVILACQPFGPKSMILCVKFSPDQNSLLVISNQRELLNLAFPFISHKCPVIYGGAPASTILEKSIFEDIIQQLKSTEDIASFISLYKDIYLCPQRWTLLHLFAIYRPDDIGKVVEIPDVKFPFLVDSYGKTPLHYMLSQAKINYVAMNAIIKYFIGYLKLIENPNPVEFYQIIESLSGIFPLFFQQINHSSVLAFLNYCVNNACIASDEPVPLFGKSNDFPIVSNCLSIPKENLDKMYDPKDNKMIGFKSMTLCLDYNPISEDMVNTCISLLICDNEDFFKTQTVSTLIDYLWNSHFSYLLFQTVAFSTLMILTSIYIGLGDSQLGFEITILTLVTSFLLMEFIQVFKYGFLSYFKSLWNIIDIVFCATLSGTMIARIAGLEESLARAWLYTVILISGYLKWIIHFRIFGHTRRLIRIVIEIVKDMSSFIGILIFIIFAFSLILLEFNREIEFTDHLLTGYGFVYGNYETEELSSSEIAIMVFVAFMVSVVLLNLLIAIMGDSYAKVEESRILVDSLEKLDMITEVIVVKRIFAPRTIKQEKGYLMFCQNSVNDESSEENENNLLEENTNLLKTVLKSVESRLDNSNNNIALLDEKVKTMAKAQEQSSSQIKAIMKIQEETSAQIREILTMQKTIMESKAKTSDEK